MGNPATETGTEPHDWKGIWTSVIRPLAADGSSARATSFRADAHGDHAAMSEASRTLLALYEPLLHTHAFVIAQLGQSLDGCVATATGDSYYVTGPDSLMHLHRLRALSAVVLVGAGTVAADDPQLTTRRVPGPQPVRAVLDPQARLDGRSGVFTDGRARTLWLCDGRFAHEARARVGLHAGVEVVGIDGLLGSSGFEPARVVAALAARGLARIFVEGGGVTVSRFLSAGCLDRLHLIVAPVFIGDGKPGLLLPPSSAMGDCPRPPCRVFRLGEDVLWDLELGAGRRPLTASDARQRA